MNSTVGMNTYLELQKNIKELEQLELELFIKSENDENTLNNELDPDAMFFASYEIKSNYFTVDEFTRNTNKEEKLSIIHFNCRSMYANFCNIKEYLQQLSHSFNIIAISETWFTDERGIDFEMEGYELTYVNRQKPCGGVAIYVHKNLRYKIIESMTLAIDNILECVTIELFNNKKNTIVTCVYRTVGSDVEVFNNWLEKTFSTIGNKSIFICGDFNIDLFNPTNHQGTDNFINLMLSMNLYPTITRPSRVTNHSATLIDNIFTNDIKNITTSGLFICDITDHLPVFILGEEKYINVKNDKKIMYKRNLTEESLGALHDELQQQNWDLVFSEQDVDKAYDIFLDIFLTLYNKHCPVQRCIINNKFASCPWLSKGLQNACKKKNNLYKQFVRLKTIESEKKYKLYKNKLTEIIRNSKKLYYKNLLDKNKSNTKKIWEILNSITKNSSKKKTYPDYFIENNKINDNMSNVANSFNQFFVKVGPDLAAQIRDTTYDINIDRNQHSIFLTPTDELEIITIVKKFKNKHSTDGYDLDMSLIKKVIHCVVKPLVHICNLSFLTGTFPGKMKMAKVIPLYKSGDKHMFTNYRPVSLLPQFSKILEKLFEKRLEKFIDKHNILNESQYGFRNKRSTSMAVMEAVEEVTNAWEKREYAVGIFIDLKKAFDTLNHEILLKKLEMYGIRGIALQWMKNYLSKRTQFVKIGEKSSSCLEISCGVPQGSILGPKLFNLYINDLFKASKTLKMVLFADDTNLFYSNENYGELIRTINVELVRVKSWMDKNKLSLNLNKTKAMFFGKYKANSNIKLNIDGVEIEKVSEYKFLGVTIDEKLTWKPHIKHVQSKVSKSIAVINRVKHLLQNDALRILYCSMILPYLTYCVEIWGNNYKSSIHPLVILQKRAVRIIHKAGYRDHTNCLFLESKLLKFSDLVKLYTVMPVFKANINILPSNVQKLFCQKKLNYNLRNSGNFKVQYANNNRKRWCVSICGVSLWNKLEPHIKQCRNIYQFKKNYKESIFLQYRNEEEL